MATAHAQSGYLDEPGASVLDDLGGSSSDDHFQQVEGEYRDHRHHQADR
jgi:hypothetical protein